MHALVALPHLLCALCLPAELVQPLDVRPGGCPAQPGGEGGEWASGALAPLEQGYRGPCVFRTSLQLANCCNLTADNIALSARGEWRGFELRPVPPVTRRRAILLAAPRCPLGCKLY